jgi:hypothetical protein
MMCMPKINTTKQQCVAEIVIGPTSLKFCHCQSSVNGNALNQHFSVMNVQHLQEIHTSLLQVQVAIPNLVLGGNNCVQKCRDMHIICCSITSTLDGMLGDNDDSGDSSSDEVSVTTHSP